MISDVILDVRPDCIPEGLCERDIWIGWTAEERTKEGSEVYPTKVPRDARTGRKCDATDPESGTYFEEVLKAYQNGEFDGIGILLLDGIGLVGVDEDDCRNPDTGEMDRAAAMRMRMIDSYTEVSPSGTGTRTFAFGEKPGPRCKDTAEGFEMYAHTRFLTVTGHHVEDTPQQVKERPDELATVYELVFGKDDPSETLPAPTVPNDVSDHALIQKAKESNDSFARLWNGDPSAYPSRSEADLALCNHLAFWTGRDARRMDALVRQSGLMREKWERDDYREPTIEKAIANCDDVYEPTRSNGARTGSTSDSHERGRDPKPFWSENDDGEVKVSLSDVVDWLEACGFNKTYEYGSDNSTKIQEQRGLIRRRSEEQIRDHVLGYLRDAGERRVLSKVRRAANHYLSSKTFDSLKPRDIDPLRDEKERAFIPYHNGVARVTAEEIQLVPYGELGRPVWRDAVLDRRIDLDASFNEDQIQDGEFARFQFKAMKEEDMRMQSLMSAQGYLVHGYKNRAQARAVIFMDEVISENPAGRTGKGLSAQGYGKMIPTTHVDARRIDLRNRFAFQSATPGVTRLLHFNDAGEHFPFERLFAAITDDMSIERKNRDRVVVPFSDSPKFLITTNFVISGRGGSHEGRVFEVEFGSYFSKDHTPEDEFGHLLFDEWDARQWKCFDNYMLQCVQLYLRHGLISYEQVNLAWKKFVQHTSPEFADFVQTFGFEANKRGMSPGAEQRYEKNAVLDSFNENQRQDTTPHTLTRWLKAYADYCEWDCETRLGGKHDHFAFYKIDNP